jgi:hypothetical protein
MPVLEGLQHRHSSAALSGAATATSCAPPADMALSDSGDSPSGRWRQWYSRSWRHARGGGRGGRPAAPAMEPRRRGQVCSGVPRAEPESSIVPSFSRSNSNSGVLLQPWRAAPATEPPPASPHTIHPTRCLPAAAASAITASN